jgi:hypothetical protein
MHWVVITAQNKRSMKIKIPVTNTEEIQRNMIFVIYLLADNIGIAGFAPKEIERSHEFKLAISSKSLNRNWKTIDGSQELATTIN